MDVRQSRRVRALVALALALVCTVVLVPAQAASAATPLPTSMASLGDSITRGFNVCGWYVDCPSRSWSTGSSTSVNSHYRRLLALNPAIYGHDYNDSRSGARMSALDMPRRAPR